MSEIDSATAGWYEATRVSAPQRPRLNLDLDVDVCVIGAGLAGLTVAREVAQRGWSVAVLEAGHVAWAASGRNIGFVLPGFSEDIDDIVERIGLDHAKQLWALSETLVPHKHVFDFNQGLMDFGATVCVARKPKCTACPMTRMCRSFAKLSRES